MALRSTAGQPQPGAGESQPEFGRTQPQVGSAGPRTGSVVIDANMARKYTAELIGTALLVFFGAGISTISFGFRAFGGSVAAGILLTGLTFGLVLLGLVAVIGPISGCHVNPAVTLGQFLAKRVTPIDAIGYVIAQLIGGLLGALLLLWVMHSSPFYNRQRIGLGANGYGRLSLLHSSGGGAFLTEVIITAVFVLVVLSATRAQANVAIQGAVIGVALALVNIMAIAIDGASANPARSFGPAIVVGGTALSQLWLFLIAPMVGAVLAAGVFMLFHPQEGMGVGDLKARMRAQPAMTVSAADEGLPPAGTATRSTAGTSAAGQPPPASGQATRTGSTGRQAGAGGAAGSGGPPGSGGAAGPGGPPPGGPDDTTGPVNPPGSMK
jgi:aquaporin Z